MLEPEDILKNLEHLRQERRKGIAMGRSEGIEMGRSEGIEMGRSEGIEMGRSEGLQEALRLLVDSRGWKLTAEQNQALVSAPTAQLKTWLQRASRAATPQDVFDPSGDMNE